MSLFSPGKNTNCTRSLEFMSLYSNERIKQVGYENFDGNIVIMSHYLWHRSSVRKGTRNIHPFTFGLLYFFKCDHVHKSQSLS